MVIFGPRIGILLQYLSSLINKNQGVIGLFKGFREFKEENIQAWAYSWLKLGSLVIQKLSRRTFIFHYILEEDKRSLLHHAFACFHASLVIFKDRREELALRDYKFAETANWVRVEGIPSNTDQTSITLNILKRVGVCIFVDKKTHQKNPNEPHWVLLGLNNGASKWINIRFEGVFVFYKKCGMIEHKVDFYTSPLKKANKKIGKSC
ncbi:Mediator of RNA polymerase II transcription subunit 13 [Bienertia sinuspersici]